MIVLVTLAALGLAQGIILSGTPPSFPDPNQPQSQFVFERDGDNNPVALTFQCPVAGDPLPNVIWYRGGVVDNVYRAPNGSYVFPNISAADSAFADGDGVEYYCTATNVFGTIRSLTVRAFYADPASITGPTPESVPDSLTEDSHTFTCSVAGSPLPTVTFYHNGVPLVDGGPITISGGTLTISPTAENHSGMYQCLVENESGTDIATWSLQVRAPKPPTITSSFAVGPDPCLGYPIIQQDAVPFTLSVTLTADPCPTASWSFNGDAIASGISNPCTDDLSITEFTFTLTVNTFEGTIGKYAVTFTNPGGSASVTDNFVTDRVRADIDDVIGIRPDPYSPVEDGSGELCLLAGSTVKIVCPNIAFPVADVFFFKNNNPVELNSRVTQSCDTLTISPVEESDRGSYSCEVDNDDTTQTEDRSNTIELEYCIAPTIVSDLVFTKNKPDEGDETSAVCEWAGSPTPEVTWLKDEEPLDKGELPSRIRIVSTNDFRSELQIREVTLDDTGDYVCNVSNPVGFAFQRKSLDVRQETCRNVTCSQHATCRNGRCVCEDGYQGDGEQCSKDNDIGLILGLTLGIGLLVACGVSIVVCVVCVVCVKRKKRQN